VRCGKDRPPELTAHIAQCNNEQLRDHQASLNESITPIRAARHAGANPPTTPITPAAASPAMIAAEVGR
jgi:hypothetical protein